MLGKLHYGVCAVVIMFTSHKLIQGGSGLVWGIQYDQAKSLIVMADYKQWIRIYLREN